MRHTLAYTGFVVGLALLFGCDMLTDTTIRIGSFEIIEGNDITTTVGSDVTTSGRVVDGGGDPISGVEVTFEVTSGGGTVDPGTVTTGSDGVAGATWTLGTEPGTQRLRARARGFELVFSVTAEPGPLAVLTAAPDSVHFTALEQTRQLMATGADTYGNETEVDGLSWSSDATGVVQVDASGLLTAQGAGSATVTAATGSIAATVDVVVEQVVDAVSVTPTARALSALGDTAHLSVQVVDANGFAVVGAAPAWTSTDAGIATVDGSGVVTAVSSGTAGIMAAADGVADTATITVEPVVSSVLVDPDSITLMALGATRQLTASTLDANGNAVAGAEIGWSSLDTAVATVDAQGTVTAVAEGATQVVAGVSTGGGTVADTARVVVTAEVTSIRIDVDTLHFAAFDDTIGVEAHGFDANANDLGAQTVTWSSTDTLIATVDAGGQVVSVGNGGARLIATMGTLVDTAGIGVRQEVSVVAVGPATDTLWAVGDTVHLTGAVSDSNGFAVADTTVAWSSSDTLVATVDTAGVVTAVSVGTARIAGTVGAVADTATIVVAAAADSVAVTPDSLHFTALGDTTQLSAAAFDSTGAAVTVTIDWSSADPGVATVDTAGNVVSVATGTTQVIGSAPAAGGGTVADTTVVVVAPVAASLAISPDSVHLASLGDTAVVEARGYDANGNDLGTQTVTWASSDPAIATVDAAGNVVSLGNGGARVAASLASPALTDTIGVGVFQEVAAVTVTPSPDTVAMEDTVALAATVTDTRGNALTRSYTTAWASDDSAVASVDSVGLVTGVMVGATTVSVTVEGIDGLAALNVAPHPNRALAVGNAMACALDVAGTAYCWGADYYWQQGDGDGMYSFAASAEPVVGGHTFQQIAGGGDLICALDVAGQAYCWGDNWAGGVGNGTTDGNWYDEPSPVVGGHTFTRIALNGYHVCGIDEAGAAWCWGYGDYDQLGDGLGTSSGTPVEVSGSLTFTDIAPGWFHTCGLSSGNQVYCWGDNSDHQFGDGTTTSSTTPTLGANGELFENIDMDWWGGCGVKADGTGMCWGYNAGGRIGDGTVTDAPSPVTVTGEYAWRSLNPNNGWTCGLTTGGTITCAGVGGAGSTGQGSFTTVTTHTAIASAESFVAVDGEVNAACGLATSGNVLCWGSSGAAGIDLFTRTPDPVGIDARSVAISGAYSCALQGTGTAWCWGSNGSGQLGDGTTDHTDSPVQVTGGVAFSALATGWGHTCGIGVADSLAYCWGDNSNGQIGDGTSGNTAPPVTATSGGVKFVDVTAGAEFTCGLSTGGQAYCWGDNRSGQAGDTTALVDTVAVPTPVDTDSFFVAVTAGNYHACALTGAGQAWCWGENAHGELGATTTEDCNGTACSSIPVLVSGELTFDTLSAGGGHTCGITAAGDAYCWGTNAEGELGDGTTTDSSTPVLVSGGLTFTRIAAIGDGVCGIDTGSNLYCWGDNGNSQLADGTYTDSSTPVQIAGLTALSVEGSNGHVCAVATDNATYCWGYKNFGQTADGMAHLHTPTAVSHGLTFFTGLTPLAQDPAVYYDVGTGLFTPLTSSGTEAHVPRHGGPPPVGPDHPDATEETGTR